MEMTTSRRPAAQEAQPVSGVVQRATSLSGNLEILAMRPHSDWQLAGGHQRPYPNDVKFGRALGFYAPYVGKAND